MCPLISTFSPRLHVLTLKQSHIYSIVFLDNCLVIFLSQPKKATIFTLAMESWQPSIGQANGKKQAYNALRTNNGRTPRLTQK